MSEQLIANIREHLNEEKWTRAALGNYSTSNLQELDEIIEQAKQSGMELEVKKLCDEHLSHTKNSIIALYLTGIISLDLKFVDDENLISLISIFKDNHRMQIVKYLASRILDFGDNKIALRTLAECYENDSDEDKKYEIWERLIRIDYDEADYVKLLAEKKEAEGNSEDAVEYYKKAMYRYINKKMFSQIKDIWQKIIDFETEDISYFMNMEKKITTVLGIEKSKILLMDLFIYYRDHQDWQICVDLLKKILDYSPEDSTARTALIKSYENLYADHKKVQEYISLSGLNQEWRNVQEAIIDFQKHISFDAGAFVFHKTWGIGIIREVAGDDIIIDFAKKRNHTMNMKMAITALSPLSKSHIWVLKSVVPVEKLKERVKSDIEWTLKTLINSFDNAMSLKKMKVELVPGVLTQNEWNTWSKNAKKVLMENPLFGNLPEQSDVFTVRQTPITQEEKLYNQFKSDKSFYSRIKILREFVKSCSTESEYFNDMFSYITSFLKDLDNVNDQVVSSYIFIRDLIIEYPYLNPGIKQYFRDIIVDKSKIIDIFIKIEDSEIKKSFINYVKEFENWAEIYVRLFPESLNKIIIDELLAAGKKEDVQIIINMISNSNKEYRNGFIWLFKNLDEFNDFEYNYNQMIIDMVSLLSTTYKEIDNKQRVSENKKYAKNIENILFKTNLLTEYIKKKEIPVQKIAKIYTIIDEIDSLSHSIKIEIKETISTTYSDTIFGNKEEVSVKDTLSRSFIVLKSSIEAKAKELKYINEVEIPKNSKEIGVAMELGDLKENAEYKAAKEKQTILNATMARLQDDIEKAHVFTESEVSLDQVGFANVVTLINLDEDKEETYTILGPWESDTDENILSYLSPFGQKLLGSKVDDVLKFEINERIYNYKIKEIGVYKNI